MPWVDGDPGVMVAWDSRQRAGHLRILAASCFASPAPWALSRNRPDVHSHSACAGHTGDPAGVRPLGDEAVHSEGTASQVSR